jgi:hypothetical protein
MKTHHQTEPGAGGLWNDYRDPIEGPRVTSIRWENILWMAPLALILMALLMLICVKLYRVLCLICVKFYRDLCKALVSAVEAQQEAAEIAALVKAGKAYKVPVDIGKPLKSAPRGDKGAAAIAERIQADLAYHRTAQRGVTISPI